MGRIRPTAGPVLLGVFLLAAQVAPVAHLATHHDGHTHGPELDPVELDGDHVDADHHHDEIDDYDHHANHDPADHDHAPANGAPSSSRGPSHGHGQGSPAHFGLALVEAPPPAFLPPPAETIALPPDTVPQGRCAAHLRQPPARGPPSLI